MTEIIDSPVPPGVEFLKGAVSTWRKAQLVHQSPSWQGQPAARAAAEEVARHPECEPLLWELLSDPDQLVVAYALIALELMGSQRLTELPETLLTNRSRISLQFGSFRNAMDLGGFARQVQKRASLVTIRGRSEPAR